MDEDNEQAQAAQRDVPGGEEAQRSWVTVVEAAVAGAVAHDVYNDVKAAGKAVVDKIRKPRTRLHRRPAAAAATVRRERCR